MPISPTVRRWLEIVSLGVAAFCIIVAVIQRLATIHWIARVEILLELAIAALLVAIWAVVDDMRGMKR